MEGLEVSEVLLSYALRSNDIFRFDSNYFQKQYLVEEKAIRGKVCKSLVEIGVELRSFGAYSLNNEVNYLESGVPFIRGVNMKKGRISFSDLIYISEEANTLLWKSEVKPGMILLSMSGTIGEVAIASKYWEYPINSNQDIAKIEITGDLNPYFLYAFLLTSFGQNYLKREARGSVQQHVFLSQIEQFSIPIFSETFQTAVQQVVEKSDETLKSTESLRSNSETLLLDALNLTGFSPSREISNIKSFKESFAASGRLDAEYYQPKFDELEARIAESHELVTLGSLLTVNQRGTQPDYAEEGLPVVNSKHVREGEVILADNRLATLSDKENALVIQQGDVLINGTGVGTIGRSAPYMHEQNAIPDNHVTILRTDKLNPIFLSVYLNSIAGKYQVDKYFKGSSGQIELYPKDIDCFYVPLIDEKIQTDIADLVKQSFKLKAESERLLEVAKRAVEIAIEESEAAALEFIKQKELP
ncbi:MAG: restriction endonuclease subunit S [Geobacteraceae bacterium]|nr:restriction endonuclease subunit S [Geobacteraceae bacterium]